jgi:hypothetical protein
MARNLIEDKIVFDYSIETMEKEVRIWFELEYRDIREIENCTIYKIKKKLPKIYYWKKEYNRSKEIVW